MPKPRRTSGDNARRPIKPKLLFQREAFLIEDHELDSLNDLSTLCLKKKHVTLFI